MPELTENQIIAKTILAQLGKGFQIMTGACNFLTIERGLSMKIPCRGSRYNYLKITLAADDTYSMHFLKVFNSRKTWEIKTTREKKLEGVYVDQLHEIIERETGLAVHMPKFANL